MAKKKSGNPWLTQTLGGKYNTAYQAAPPTPNLTQYHADVIAEMNRQIAASAPPIDPAYEAYKVSSQRNIALADADAQYQTGRIENQYGLGSDTSNPYSQAKLLQEKYQRDQRGSMNSMAAQGQLYSGAYGRRQGEDTRNYSMGYDQLSRGYADAKTNVLRGKLNAYNNNTAGVDQAQFDALLRALGGK